MTKKYFSEEFESKWIKKWEEKKLYQVSSVVNKQKKFYTLVEFPYPSGAGLHVGHARSWTAMDVYSRQKRMRGYQVLYPMGWDAFGLPAENYAIKMKIHPSVTVAENISKFKRQCQSLGFSFDWSREVNTTDPEYYKWTQWIFIQLFKQGLAFQDKVAVNWCSFCKTNLADEEVMADGTHERCGKKTEKKMQKQWLLRITKYAQRLLDDLDKVDYSEQIKKQQVNWIGEKSGINITYQVLNPKSEIQNPKQIRNNKIQISKKEIIDSITCFTTRPDTNFGATFIVIAPEHEFVASLLNSKFKIQNSKLEEIKQYVEKSIAKSEQERLAEGKKKTGIFTGFYAINDLNGRLMPIWISDFVLAGFGTGAVVGVPGHDLRDFEFAKEFGIDILRVVVGKDNDKSQIVRKEQVQEKEGRMINSGFLDGMDIHEATKKMMDYMEEKKYGKRVTTYHLRDWVFSRQHYWGEPIPMVYCQHCAKNRVSYFQRYSKSKILNSKFSILDSMYGWFPVPEKNLPVKLPYVKSYQPTTTGESPLAKIDSFVKTKCPNCGGEARRETDTMPNWAGSNWYFIRYLDNKNNKEIAGREKMNCWLPVDMYQGGFEHTTLHLLYSRFIYKFLFDIGVVPNDEPYAKRRSHGIVLGGDNRKMSKSFGNVINPDDIVKEYGADTLRLYEMFMGPFDQMVAWSDEAVAGVNRFLKRVWEIYQKLGVRSYGLSGEENKQLIIKLNKTIKKVTEDIEKLKFNTAVAAMMEFLNDWEHCQAQFLTASVKIGLARQSAKKFLQILAPFAPFMTEEIWHSVFDEKESIHLSKWPEIDKDEVVEEEIVIPVQVNGKLKTTIRITNHELRIKGKIQEKALGDERIKNILVGKKYKVIYVPGKILNFVII